MMPSCLRRRHRSKITFGELGFRVEGTGQVYRALGFIRGIKGSAGESCGQMENDTETGMS